MKKIFLLVILIGLIWFLNSSFSNSFKKEIQPALSPTLQKAQIFVEDNISIFNFSGACKKPLTYKISQLDSGFNITKEDLVVALKQSEDIWESEVNKDLFKYDPNNGELVINLIYDYRQEATNKLTSIDNELKDSQTKYNSVKSEYLKIKNQYNTAISKYNINLNSYNKLSLEYQNKVKYWNSRGGAPKNEYTILQNQKISLDRKFNALQIEQNNVNKLASSVNTLAMELNRLADALNLNVQKYNTIGEQLGESFKEGLYTKDGSSQKIDIYEFSSNTKLVRVLAHEFGHALGIDHLSDVDSIMYEQNESNNLKLTNFDLDALKLVCEI